MAGKPWTAAELTEAERLWNLGESHKAIARAMGRTPTATSAMFIRNRERFPRRNAGPDTQGQWMKLWLTAWLRGTARKEAAAAGVSMAHYLRVAMRVVLTDEALKRRVVEHLRRN